MFNFLLGVLFMMFLNYICFYLSEFAGWKYDDEIKTLLVLPFYLLFHVILYYPIKQVVIRFPCYKCLRLDIEDKTYYKCSLYDYNNKIDLKYWKVFRGCSYTSKQLKNVKSWKKYYKN